MAGRPVSEHFRQNSGILHLSNRKFFQRGPVCPDDPDVSGSVAGIDRRRYQDYDHIRAGKEHVQRGNQQALQRVQTQGSAGGNLTGIYHHHSGAGSGLYADLSDVPRGAGIRFHEASV